MTHDSRKNSSSSKAVGRSLGVLFQLLVMTSHNPSWCNVGGRPGRSPFKIANIAVL